jgi:predicted O-methyltransferase YrrM
VQFRIANSWNFGKIPSTNLQEVLRTNKINVKGANVIYPESNSHSLTSSETIALASLVSTLAPTSILEIGTGTGFTAQLMAINAKDDCVITTVDLPESLNAGELGLNIKEIYWNRSQDSYLESNSRLGNLKNVKREFMDSLDLSLKINKEFDFIFIDGCHDLKYVINDSQQALKLIRQGGVILWHDYRMLPEVSKFLDKFSRTRVLFAIEGTRFVILFN